MAAFFCGDRDEGVDDGGLAVELVLELEEVDGRFGWNDGRGSCFWVEGI